MNLRSLAILILLVPMLSSVGSLVNQGRAESDERCCEVTQVVSCCGEVIETTTCSTTGGECQCVASPADQPIPSSIPFLPLTLGSLVFELAPPTELMFESAVEAPSTHRVGFTRVPTLSSSHQQAQAILGIWRI